MLAVVGSPRAGAALGGRVAAAGLASDIARQAAAAGAAVQVVGRVGDDDVGDAVLLDLAAANVGHVAVLRTPGAPTPLAGSESVDVDEEAAGVALDEESGKQATSSAGLDIDADDLELALRYLPDYRVIVVAPGLDVAALTTVVGAAGWSGAHLVVIDDGSTADDALLADATVLVQPSDPDSAFAAVVARYAVELDGGAEPGAAFATASRAVGWQPVEP